MVLPGPLPYPEVGGRVQHVAQWVELSRKQQRFAVEDGGKRGGARKAVRRLAGGRWSLVDSSPRVAGLSARSLAYLFGQECRSSDDALRFRGRTGLVRYFQNFAKPALTGRSVAPSLHEPCEWYAGLARDLRHETRKRLVVL